MSKKNYTNFLAGIALKAMALMFNTRPFLNKKLKCTDGWINFCIGISTVNGTVEKAILFKDGHVSVLNHIPENADAVLRFTKNKILREAARVTPNEMLNLILKNKLILEGNMAWLQAFNYYISLIMGKKHQKMLDALNRKELQYKKKKFSPDNPALSVEIKNRSAYRMKANADEDPGVKYLEDPYLCEYSLEDFPRCSSSYLI